MNRVPQQDGYFFTWSMLWQFQSPDFSSDIDTYIWQPYRKPPPYSFVKIYILKNTSTDELCAFFLFDSIQSLQGFRFSCKLHESLFSGVNHVSFRLARYLYAAHQMILSNMIHFLDKTVKTLTAIVSFSRARIVWHLQLTLSKTFQGRTYPSKEKVLHILHMNDCRETAIQDMQQNRLLVGQHANFIKALSSIVQEFADDRIEKEFEALTVDYNFVLQELNYLGPKLRQIQTEVIPLFQLYPSTNLETASA